LFENKIFGPKKNAVQISGHYIIRNPAVNIHKLVLSQSWKMGNCGDLETWLGWRRQDMHTEFFAGKPDGRR
jgi:hypothetical protein